MKKILSVIVSVIVSVGMNAQVVKVYENGVLSNTYTNSSSNTVKVVFEEVPAYPAGSRGTAKATLTAGSSTETDVQWVQLWENGPKWAVFNVGATSVSEYGGYYYWGSTNTTSYSSSTEDIQYGNDDTAKNLWGNNWQMPKKTDYDDLLVNCDVTWTTQNGMNGRFYTGKGDYSSNSVFFPAAGFYYGSVIDQGLNGCYWSSAPYDASGAYLLDFKPNDQYVYDGGRFNGCSVRAVLK